MDDLDAAVPRLLAAWPIGAPRAVRRLHSGLNNRSWCVETPQGTYVLRRYRNAGALEHIRYEHALLDALHGAEMSFRIPAPLRTRGGDTLYAFTDDGDAVQYAALCPLLPGYHPDRTRLADIAAAAAAYGEMGAALARVHLPTPPSHGTMGDLHTIHPLVPDPHTVPDTVGRDDAERRRLRDLFAAVGAAVPALYRTLPMQMAHRDVSGGNVLIADGRPTGVLDFEFAGPDLRVLDFAIALYFIPLIYAFAGEIAVLWERVAAYCRGYGAWVRPTPAEIAALPTLLQLRFVIGLIHWTGRARQGLTPADQVTADDLLHLDTWLAAHGDELITRVAGWLGAAG